MTHKCYDEDIATLSRGMADPTLCRVYEAFQRTNGVLTKANEWALPHLSITTDEVKPDVVPPIIVVGSKTSQRMWFGQEWSDCPLTRHQFPLDLEMEMVSAPAYCKAASGTPYYGIAVFDTRHSPGLNKSTGPLTIDRLVFPIRFKQNGPTFCAYMGSVLSQA